MNKKILSEQEKKKRALERLRVAPKWVRDCFENLKIDTDQEFELTIELPPNLMEYPAGFVDRSNVVNPSDEIVVTIRGRRCIEE